LQIFGKDGGWHKIPGGDIDPKKGIKLGSVSREGSIPLLKSMAPRHFRITPEGSMNMVQDLGSLNGVFRRITQPTALTEGLRFRVGQYLIEFRAAEPPQPAVPLTKDGEELCCVDPVVPAYLVFIRPDGRHGLRYPLTKTETVLGQEREGEPLAVDIHLPAEETSGRHARVFRKHGRFMLENLSQTVGTFVRIEGSDQIKLGEEFLAGQVRFRVVRERDG
jgi:hypothetical protein